LNPNSALVVTSISAPNQPMRDLAEGCLTHDVAFFVIGDSKSPAQYSLPGAEFFSLEQQRDTGFRFAALCPEKHYARKNVGYLLAIWAGAKVLVETDDDNLPRSDFWALRTRQQRVSRLDKNGWTNVYQYFTDAHCWPRGLPLDAFHRESPTFDLLQVELADCPIHQGLADEDPDVDAIFRLFFHRPVNFRSDRRVAFGPGTWCPFNSQNTTWWPDAYALMYLPAYCSVRMTDIWRGFVAQRIAWTNAWCVLFHSPTVYQLRNEHDLMRDFRDEIPGYLNNRRIAEIFEQLPLQPGVENIGDNLRLCYESLVKLELVDRKELALVDAWLEGLEQAGLPELQRKSD